MSERMRLIVLVGMPLLAVVLYALLSVLFGGDYMLWVAGTFLALLDRVLGILVFLPPWASWAVILFLLAAGARFLLWENQKVSEGQRVAAVVAALALFLLAAVVPPLLGLGRGPERGRWWRPDTYRAAGSERVFEGISFVWVPAGHYIMGSPVIEPGRDKWGEQQQEVDTPRGFWISREEITVGQYKEVMGNSPKEIIGAFDRPELPVTGVSYDESLAFARRLTEKGRGTYRLPKESEWEYACRAGSTAPWSFGGDAAQLPDYAWYNVNSKQEPHPVGTRKPNLWGVHDMHGNAAEWCLESGESGKDAAFRVYRGGNWDADASQCRSAARGLFVLDKTHLPGFVGIRLVREP